MSTKYFKSENFYCFSQSNIQNWQMNVILWRIKLLIPSWGEFDLIISKSERLRERLTYLHDRSGVRKLSQGCLALGLAGPSDLGDGEHRQHVVVGVVRHHARGAFTSARTSRVIWCGGGHRLSRPLDSSSRWTLIFQTVRTLVTLMTGRCLTRELGCVSVMYSAW